MLSAVIRNRQVVTPHGVGVFDVGIAGELVAAVAAPGSLPSDGARVIDASGKIVVPGGIDPHIHAKWAVPAEKNHPAVMSADPAHVSRAALFGGTTTIIDFAPRNADESLASAIARRDGDFKGQCHCDYAYHVM